MGPIEFSCAQNKSAFHAIRRSGPDANGSSASTSDRSHCHESGPISPSRKRRRVVQFLLRVVAEHLCRGSGRQWAAASDWYRIPGPHDRCWCCHGALPCGSDSSSDACRGSRRIFAEPGDPLACTLPSTKTCLPMATATVDPTAGEDGTTAAYPFVVYAGSDRDRGVSPLWASPRHLVWDKCPGVKSDFSCLQWASRMDRGSTPDPDVHAVVR